MCAHVCVLTCIMSGGVAGGAGAGAVPRVRVPRAGPAGVGTGLTAEGPRLAGEALGRVGHSWYTSSNNNTVR